MTTAHEGLHTECEGHGARTLVMLHGWGVNLRVFDRLSAALSAEFRCLRVDLPGHGRSPLPNTDAWSQESLATQIAAILPRTPFVLLGWSLGGQLALELAKRFPEHCRALLLVATTPKFVASADWPHGMNATVANKFATALQQDYERTVADFLELQVRGSQQSSAVLHELQAALLAHGAAQPRALSRGLQFLYDTDLRAALPQIATPALVISGQYDRITPPAATRALAQQLPNARLLELPRAGHAPFLSHCAEVAAATREFLEPLW
jgi:pimeloyl-[acyl-carrier protein] methyl ester esterase